MMYSRDEETICAIASAEGDAAIGVIRVSGRKAVSITDRIFRNPSGRTLSSLKSYSMLYGHLVNPETEEVLDEVVVLFMKAPHTYTTEDCVEIDCHGGTFVMNRILDLLIQNGARAAEPGEFTKRAFLGGRIDLTEAEAVMDIVQAENDMALSAAESQLSGSLRKKIEDFRHRILHETARIESALDDPEHYSLEGYSEILEKIVERLRKEIQELLDTADEGRRIREGVRTVILGRPNVGKSSVLNRLLGEDRAIVTSVAGTTRDILEEYVNLGGFTLKLIDTAGIRQTEDEVEQIGVKRAMESLNSADLVLLVLDGSMDLTEEDRELIRRTKDHETLVLLNKSDKPRKVSLPELTGEKISGDRVLAISARDGTGFEEIKVRIRDLFFGGKVKENHQVLITHARQKEALLEADRDLKRVQDSIQAEVGEDFYTVDLMAAYEDLGNLIGERLGDDLADEIFRDFCMGK